MGERLTGSCGDGLFATESTPGTSTAHAVTGTASCHDDCPTVPGLGRLGGSLLGRRRSASRVLAVPGPRYLNL
eukprot:760641-Hanusia_phi.AAC.2